MDTVTLKTFITIADCGSFSQAADKLFLTQPAISKRIAQLEQELGTRLFDRIGRQTTLTEAGRILRQRAQQILLEIDDSKREIANLSGDVSGSLVLGTSHHISLHRLPPVLRSYVPQYPKVKLDIRFLDSEAACYGVQNGTLELAVITLPLEPAREIRVKKIWTDPLHIVVGHSHPLARSGKNKSSSVKLADLLAHPAILPDERTFTRQLLQLAIADSGETIKVSMSTNYLETIKMLVTVGLGWSLLPETMLDKELVTLNVRNIRLKRELGAVWHAGRTLSNACKAMLETLAAC
jgi:DNA-binding transcriptional LysR family regulator